MKSAALTSLYREQNYILDWKLKKKKIRNKVKQDLSD